MSLFILSFFAVFLLQSTPPPTENSGSSTSSGGSSNYGTLGRGGGNSMASMMDEMAKTLARRRAAVSHICLQWHYFNIYSIETVLNNDLY